MAGVGIISFAVAISGSQLTGAGLPVEKEIDVQTCLSFGGGEEPGLFVFFWCSCML